MFDPLHLDISLRELGLCLTQPMVNKLFGQFALAYGHPSRHYHSQAHIVDCLELLQRYQALADRPQEVAIALWFHDAIYETHCQDNEERSAAWARAFLKTGQASEDIIRRIEDLIMVTKTHTSPADPDQALLLDIDLSILGQSPNVFQCYDRAIREEYAWVPEVSYRSARRAVLQGFLERPYLYHTEPLRALYEAPARKNLSQAIVHLLTPNSFLA